MELLDQLAKTPEEIKSALHQNGLHRVYEKKGHLIVQQSDEVQVKIVHQAGRIVVKPKLPQLGNTFQVVMTVVLLVVFLIFDVPFKVLLAFLLAQLAAFALYLSKINRLKKRVIDAIR